MATHRICSISDCGKPMRYASKGWCNMHYQRWRAHGDPLVKVKSRTPPGEVRDYLDTVVLPYDGDECLLWPYAKHEFGYGMINGKLVHRIACEQENGPPPFEDAQAAHSCGNGHLGCVTKRHLRWATRRENQLDMNDHGTSNRGERCPTGKLTADDVREIRRLRGRKSFREIANQFGISRGHVKGIYYGRAWAWLDQ